MPEILTDAYLLFTFVFKQALSNFATPKPKFCNPHRRQQIICAG